MKEFEFDNEKVWGIGDSGKEGRGRLRRNTRRH